VLLVISGFLFINYYPSFGGEITKESQEKYKTSVNYSRGKFVNVKAVPKEPSFSEMLSIARKFFFTKVSNARPKKDLKVAKLDSTVIADYESSARLFWYGHSAFLLQIEKKNILLDPMFGEVAAPHPLLGAKRFNKEIPLEIEKLPKIDAVVISHDHYDHLDYESIKALDKKVSKFFTPLGVGVHLEAWGIEKERIIELDWWNEVDFEGLKLVCTPSQHFSGRKFTTNGSTLWSSWVIKSGKENIFFSGDSGYGEHFKEIGEKYGPFDLALMECGQYNESWPDIHMFPEETAQAGLDVRANKIMPIHWAGFKLALHDWIDPITRVSKKAKELELRVITPSIGEPIVVNSEVRYEEWWKGM